MLNGRAINAAEIRDLRDSSARNGSLVINITAASESVVSDMDNYSGSDRQGHRRTNFNEKAEGDDCV